MDVTRYVADQLHAMGLKLGVYTDLTDHSCGTGPGSKGHYIEDANTFAHDWEADYLLVTIQHHTAPCMEANLRH